MFFSAKDIRLTAVVDACHSGTMLDLPFIALFTPEKRMITELYINEPITPQMSHPFILYLSGCLDDETSADVEINGAPAAGNNF